MLGTSYADPDLVDHARVAMAPMHDWLQEAVETLAAGRSARGRRRQLLRGALRHALAFSTWRSLTASGITRTSAAMLVTALVEAAATSDSRTAA
jgi:hypothetical protein